MAFFTKKKPVEPPVEKTTLIAEGVRVEGELTSRRTVALRGDFHGSIRAMKEFRVENGATFSGEANAGVFALYGKAKGNITCGTARFYPGSYWNGKLKASRLQVEKGAELAGEIKENQDK